MHSIATMVGLIIASAMFFSLEATAPAGDEVDCAPAPYALFASSPAADEPDPADCRSEAWQRMTTVTGLVLLTVIGSYIGGRLARTPTVARPRTNPPTVTVVQAPRRPNQP